jgi:HAD superfamily phosphatase (TIGR01668 family)
LSALASSTTSSSPMANFLPDAVFDKVTDITADWLLGRKILGIALDVDNTIAKYSESLPAPEIVSWIETLRNTGIRTVIVSNSRKGKRVPDISKALGLPYIVKAGKPSRKGFIQAAELIGTETKNMAVIGDQIFTDVLGAKRAGCKAFLVNPRGIDESLWFSIRRWFETPFIRIAVKSMRGENQ